MAMYMRENISRVKFKVKVGTNGNLESVMKGNGMMDIKKDMEFGKDLRMTHMLVNGRIISHMVLENIFGVTEINMKVNGKHA